MIAGGKRCDGRRFQPSSQPTLGLASELSGYPDKAAGRYLRRTKQEIATPLYRQKAQLAKVSAAAGRLLVEVTKLAPDLAVVSVSGLLDLNA